ncbi:serine/threonine-protein phosphatase 6 regulatory ankyrin repeat subunit C-like [Trichogramma pretiosum]|uniref:serine/threonine-protein phosphatase 6 regulatory ankyrin repeat subunit C-like n=1 Tax=Trichogramma pretiosum TaxID=7493 RepID=UPI0006C99E8C|nr:serine/threonine-protein phosphatase 6 regulatory ankyrin repeat subunit C-like [Trichogramma pretiosum]
MNIYTLSKLRAKVKEDTEENKFKFLNQLYRTVKNWKGEIPNVQDICTDDNVVWYLSQSTRKFKTNTFITWLLRSGYKDRPKFNEAGEPLVFRTTPVHRATRRRDRDFVRDLFKIYTNLCVNYVDEETGLTHFHVACQFGFADVVEKFLELGQDPNCPWRTRRESTLHLALKWNQKQVIELLLRSGADVNSADEEGSTPLHRLIEKGSFKLAKLFFGICDETRQTVQVNAQDDQGWTPIQYAVQFDFRKAAALLLRRGADPNIVNVEEKNVLHIMCQKDTDDDTVRLFFIGNSSPRVNAQDKLGNTPLHLALMNAHKELAEVLLRNGADPNVCNEDGSTPLHIICKRNVDNEDLVETFFKINDDIRQTVQIDAKDKLGRTPLQCAVAHLMPDTVDVLLDHGADTTKFIFPSLNDFTLATQSFRFTEPRFLLVLASGALDVAERLKNNGNFFQNDAQIIINLFNEHKLFKKTAGLNNFWYDNDDFKEMAKRTLIPQHILSLYDLVEFRYNETINIFSYAPYFKFAHSMEKWDRLKEYEETCALHLCKVIINTFRQQWE